jgi:chemotaxis protein methyltransferase CheR
MPALPAPAPVVAILADLVEERTGLHYGVPDRDMLVEKIADRAVEAGFESLLDYYYFLRYDPEAASELDRLIDALVVGETYLFREFEPLRLIVHRFVEPLVRSGVRPRIWSAACATGEEPITLAMLLADAGLLERVELVASDISERSLSRARQGKFGRRSLRTVPSPELRARYVLEDRDGAPRVTPELLSAIEWRRINLNEPDQVATVGRCHVILCRNVLIYFSDETTAKVVSHLSNALEPNGVLMVGVSESLLRFSTALECQEVDHVFCYRKVP